MFFILIQHPRNTPFWEVFGPLLPKMYFNFAEVLTRGSTLASKNIVWNTIERFEFLSKRDGPKGSTFRLSFAAPSEKPQPLDYPNMSKSKLYLLFPFRKKYYYFLHYLGYFWQETGRRHKWKDQNQNLTYFFSPTIVGQLPWKKIWFQHFPVLQLQITEGFQVWLLFLVPYLHFWKKNESDILKQNLILNQLVPTSNPKMKNQKARAPFSNCFFISRPFNLKFFLFSRQFWTVEKFLPSRSEPKRKK